MNGYYCLNSKWFSFLFPVKVIDENYGNEFYAFLSISKAKKFAKEMAFDDLLETLENRGEIGEDFIVTFFGYELFRCDKHSIYKSLEMK